MEFSPLLPLCLLHSVVDCSKGAVVHEVMLLGPVDQAPWALVVPTVPSGVKLLLLLLLAGAFSRAGGSSNHWACIMALLLLATLVVL